jgi:predicted dehydrogenase
MSGHGGALRWGVISTANIATEKAIPGLRRAARCELLGIASRDGDAARAVAERLAIPRHYSSYEALLGDGDIDAVYIPLPNHLHLEWTIAAARAGKHVLCEKPLALTAADAQRMIDTCAEAGVLLMEAFMYRLHPSWEGARSLVESGRIGRLIAVDSWFSFFNDDPANIRNIPEAGGGAMYEIGCYCVNLSRMLFRGEPTRVTSAVRRETPGGVDVAAGGVLEFPDGLATFGCSIRAEDDQRVSIYGTKGRISIEIPFNIPPDRETAIQVAAGGDPPVAPAVERLTFPVADPYAVEAERFAGAVLDGGPVPIPPGDAVANLRVIEAVLASGV